jgi:hypothetical protein
MCVLNTRYGGVAAYLALVCTLILLLANLSSHVVSQVIALALPHFPDKGPRPLSRVERQIVAAEAAPLPPEQTIRLVVLNAPAESAKVLAARMDLAEKADLRGIPPAHRPIRQAARRIPAPVAISAGEEFGRRFGVMVASR